MAQCAVLRKDDRMPRRRTQRVPPYLQAIEDCALDSLHFNSDSMVGASCQSCLLTNSNPQAVKSPASA
eukprot:scaffold67826_cov16-Prasinocladus_malaysianus.AAC.1